MSEILLVAMYCTFQNGMIANFNFFFLEIGRHVDTAKLIFHTKPLSPAVKSGGKAPCLKKNRDVFLKIKIFVRVLKVLTITPVHIVEDNFYFSFVN